MKEEQKDKQVTEDMMMPGYDITIRQYVRRKKELDEENEKLRNKLNIYLKLIDFLTELCVEERTQGFSEGIDICEERYR